MLIVFYLVPHIYLDQQHIFTSISPNHHELTLLEHFFRHYIILHSTRLKRSLIKISDLTGNSKIGNSGTSRGRYEKNNPQYPIKNHNKPPCTSEEENNEQLYIKSRKKINNCNTRAGGLAWLRYRLDMAGVVGSNPTRPIQKVRYFHLKY